MSNKKPRFKDLPDPEGEDRDKLDQVFQVDTRYGIIMAIDNFGSLNIKKIAKILGKNEATIHHHIKWLSQNPSLLAIDQEKTMQTKGIFYVLSDISRKYAHILGLKKEETQRDPNERKGSENIEKLLELSIEELTQFHSSMIQQFATDERDVIKELRLMTYNHILENIILQNFEQAVIAFKDGLRPKNQTYPFGALSNFALDMKVSNIHHLYRVIYLLTKFNEDFLDLRDQIHQEMVHGAIDENDKIDLHFHIVGGEIAEFEFE